MNVIKEKMLQGVQPISIYADHGAAAPQTDSQGITFEFMIGFLRRRAMFILISALFMTMLGVAYFFLVPAPYTAVATLEIDTRRFQLFQHSENLGEKLIDSSAAVESQLEVLKSENIALKVIKKLQLADDLEFGGANTIISQIPLIGDILAKKVSSESVRIQNAVGAIEKSLKVKRLGGSFIIEISFQSTHSDRAAQIANAIAESYIEYQLDSRYESTRQGSKWLESRLSELRDQIASAQKAVIGYKAQNNLIEDTRGRLITEQQLTDLNNQIAVARAKKTELQTQIDRIGKILSKDPKDPSADAIGNVGGDIIKNNLLIDKLRTQYIEIASREKEWSEKYGSSNLVVVNLRNNLRAIRGAIRDELQRTENSLRSDYDAASELEKSLQGQLEKAVVESQSSDKSQVTLRQLESSAQEYKKLYDNFLTRHSEAVEQQSFQYTEARLITKATPPLHRTYRKTLLIAALFPFAGVFFGAGIGALREYFDQGLRTSSQVENMLGLNCLALIPMQDIERVKSSWLNYLNVNLISSPLPNAGEQLKAINVLDQPFSQFAESIRSVKLAIDLSGNIPPNKVIGLTSSIPNEGKTTIAAELAQGIAQAGAHVILVDCDFRNPSLSRAIAPRSTCGILDVLANKKVLAETMWKHESTNLAFLPASLNLRVANSSEILSSPAIRKLFAELSQRFDYVIVDLPPIAPLVDVRATGHFIDSYIFVIEWGKTNGAIAEHALGAVAPIRDKVLGAVLNKVDMMQMPLYDGNLAAYYNNKYYSRYGET